MLFRSEEFDRRGKPRKDACDFILENFREEFRGDEFRGDVKDDAVDRFLRRAEKGEFGKPIPRYRNQFGWLDLEGQRKWKGWYRGPIEGGDAGKG